MSLMMYEWLKIKTTLGHAVPVRSVLIRSVSPFASDTMAPADAQPLATRRAI